MPTVTDVTPRPNRATKLSLQSLAHLPFGVWFPIAVFALMRLVDALFIMIASRHQIPMTTSVTDYYVYSATPADPGYWSIITNWDGQWYKRIATDGYGLPDGTGSLESSYADHAFAFLPLYPLLCALVMWLTGLGFAVSASIVSLLSGAGAMVVLFKVVARTSGPFAAACGVSLVSAFISAPVLQLAYKESVTLLLLFLWFLWLQQRRYWWAVAAVLALCFTKYLTAPIAVVIAAHALQRWRLRTADPVGRGEWLGMVSNVAVSVSGVFAWGALLRLWIGGDAMDRNQILGAQTNRASGAAGFGTFGQFYEAGGLWGLAIPMGIVCVLILVSFSAYCSSWGTEARAWLWAYPTYVLAGAVLGSPMLRYLLPAFPLALLFIGSPARDKVPHRKVWLVVACCLIGLAAQWWWINTVLVIDPPGVTSGEAYAP